EDVRGEDVGRLCEQHDVRSRSEDLLELLGRDVVGIARDDETLERVVLPDARRVDDGGRKDQGGEGENPPPACDHETGEWGESTLGDRPGHAREHTRAPRTTGSRAARFL